MSTCAFCQLMDDGRSLTAVIYPYWQNQWFHCSMELRVDTAHFASKARSVDWALSAWWIALLSGLRSLQFD